MEMIVTDDSWYVVRNTPNVTGFVGAGTTPVPVSLKEIEILQKKMGVEAPQYKIDFELGDPVKITDGPFKDYDVKVSEIDRERGKIKVNDEIEVVGMRDTQKTTITGIEMFNKSLDEGIAGDNAGILLRGLKKEDVERGQVIVKPGSVTPHTEFDSEVYILTKEEGGRHTPFFGGYKPQFYIRTTDVTGEVTLPQGTEMVMPGDTIKFTVKLIVPVALEEKQRFAIREGGKTVGAGVVTKILK